MSIANANCVPTKKMKEYLSGWLDDQSSDSIESHLKECSRCEELISSLEREPDSIADQISEQIAESIGPGGKIAVTEFPNAYPDAAVAYAIERAKKQSDPSESFSRETPTVQSHIGPYEIERVLGHGGMGSVYLAMHSQLHKQVAVKILPSRPFRNDNYAARFMREIRTAGQLNHQAIVQATDAGESDGMHYLVMEYVDGLDVSRIARIVGELSIADACAIASVVAMGLSHAHSMGIVHRDIKPSNLMLSKSGQVKILDFGLARVSLWDEASAELTTVGQLMGTLDYMAPEQAERAESVDYRADLYSLGATLFRLLCGRPPLVASPDLSPLAKLRVLASQKSPRLDTLRPDAPTNLVSLVARLLARDPNDRPASAAHVAEELGEFKQGSNLTDLVALALERNTELKSVEPAPASSFLGPSLKAPAKRVSGSGNGLSRWLLAAAMAPLALFGIFLTLEWNKGQLIIESEGAHVDVKLSRDGKQYDKLTVVPGVNSTRLFAGKYEITIDGTQHELELDRTQIDIKRGDTLIARIRSQSTEQFSQASPRADSSQTALAVPKRIETLYEGKSLTGWLDEFDREAKIDQLNVAFKAIQSLISNQTKAMVVDRIWTALPTKRDVSSNNSRSEFDRGAISLLSKYSAEKDFHERFAEELRKDESEWTLRLLPVYLRYSTAKFENIRPVLDVIESRLKSPTTTPDFHTQFAKLLIRCVLSNQVVDVDNDRVLNILTLAKTDWFTLYLNDPERMKPQGKILANFVQKKAVDAIINPATPQLDVLIATHCLTMMYSTESIHAMLDVVSRRQELALAIGRRLQMYTSDIHSLSSLEEIAFNTVVKFAPSLLDGVKTNGGNGEFRFTSLPAELLQLASQLDLTNSIQSETAAIRSLTLDQVVQLNRKLVPTVLTPPNAIVNLYHRAGRFKIESGNLSEALWEKLTLQADWEKTTHEQLVAYWILCSIARSLPSGELQNLRDEIATKRRASIVADRFNELDTDHDAKLSYDEVKIENSDPAIFDRDQNQTISEQELLDILSIKPMRSARSTLGAASPDRTGGGGTPKPAELLYDNKPLAEWLDTFTRETSPKRLEESLNAISALRSTDTATQIFELLWNTLPKKPKTQFEHEEWTDKVVTPAQGGRGAGGGQTSVPTVKRSFISMDQKVIDILRSCVSVKTFNQRVAEEWTKGSPAWQKRILLAALSFSSGTLDDQIPLIELAEKVFNSESSDPFAIEKLADLMVAKFTRENPDKKKEDRLYQALTSAKRLNDDYWLAMKPTWGRTYPWLGSISPRIGNYVQARAVDAVLDANSPITSVAGAVRILTETTGSQEVVGLEVTPRKDELTSEIRRRLNSMIDNKGKLTQLASTSSASPPSLRPISSHLQVFFPQHVTLAVENNNPSPLFFVGDLLFLASKLNLGDELRRVQEQSMDTIVEFAEKQFPDPYSSETKVIHLAGPSYLSQSSPAGVTDVQGSEQTSDNWWLVWEFNIVNATSPPVIQNEILESLSNQRRQRHAARMLESMDTDKDGKVSIAESGLTQSDTDQDGTISSNEYVDYMLRRNPNALRLKLEIPTR